MAATPAVVFRTKRTSRPKRLLLGLLWAFLILFLKRTSCAFGQSNQESLGALRERTGQATRVKVKDVLGNDLPLSVPERRLLRNISIASDKRNWKRVQSIFATYTGKAIQIYTAVMNAALRCREYEEGALIYEKCRAVCARFEEPTFNAAVKIFAKLGRYETVQRIWDEAIKECQLSYMLVASRIDAAAEQGDVETAATMLDLLNTSKLEVNQFVITSAIRSCWGWGAKQHQAAKYFWNLFPQFNSKPDIVAFTALIGAYMTAPLDDVLSVKTEMAVMGIPPNRVFAETFLASVVQQDFKRLREVDDIVIALQDKSPARLQVARETLQDFEATGVELTALCKKIRRALEILKP